MLLNSNSNILSWIGAILTSIVLIPQSFKIIRTRDTKSLSLYMYIIFVLSAITWIIFAILSNQPAIITTNTIVLFFASIILILKINNIFRKKEKP
ncbi:SemiSWEET family sugar transporter [Spiroplasma endosymbiont of Cleonymus obscurus]|uniref:SemiSWEET family sugar transporter n=1 Tax=Spiroplasma endosymbiont of Cleonymus obscurus TaxID=3066324 RepID=UPI0037DDCF24